MTDDLGTATTVTIEVWFNGSADTGERELFAFVGQTLADARGVSLSLVDASAQGFGSLTGRVLHVVVDARQSGGDLNARGFELGSVSELELHHYALVFDGSTQRMFVDGIELTVVQQRDGSEGTSFDDAFGSAFVGGGGTITMHVGRFPRDDNRHLFGGMQDVRVSSTARYTSGFTPPYPLATDADTIGVWALDEGSGTDSIDGSGNGYTITWSGDPDWNCPSP